MVEIQITPKFIETFENLISEEMATLSVLGFAIAIVKDNEIIYSQGFGARDADEKLPADIDTIFGIASDTKSFVSLAILILVDQGKLSLDDPVEKYVPLKLSIPEHPITIRHLMSHSSGLPDLGGGTFHYAMNSYNLPVQSYSKQYPFTSKEDFYRHLNAGKEYVSDPPGKRFYYNNNGYQILGDIIEIVSGKSMDEFIKKNILEKLDMKRSTFDPDDLAQENNKAQGYINIPVGEKSKLTKIPYFKNNTRKSMNAAGGMFTSVRERVNYVIMHLNDGEFNGKRIISEELLKEMHTPQFPEDSIAVRNFKSGSAYAENYGFGLFLSNNYEGYKFMGHGGNFLGCTSDFLLFPELNLGIVAAANNMAGPRGIIYNILPLLLGKDKEDLDLIRHRKHLKKLSGIYEAYRGGRIKVSHKGASIYIEDLEQSVFTMPPTPIIPLHDDLDCMEFYIMSMGGIKPIIEFTHDANKQIWLHIERRKLKKIKDL